MTSSRGQFLKTTCMAAASGSLGAASSAPTAVAQARTTTFVLVHGAWHGGWCWRRVVPILRGAGHDVYTPSLTGLGDRAHLSRPEINLDAHIQDIVTLIEMEELDDIVLVGHSYAGMVVTGVADRVPSKIRRLVYLDAFLPTNGKAQLDYVVPDRAAAMKKQGEETGMIDPLPLSRFGVTKPEDVAWASRHIVKQSYQTMAQPIKLTNEAATGRLPKTYVYCSSPATGSFDQFVAIVRNDPAWQFFEMKNGHDVMIIDPEGLAKVLLQTV
jgi:pimeloyl-ACP methyl ester carboxylesterase